MADIQVTDQPWADPITLQNNRAIRQIQTDMDSISVTSAMIVDGTIVNADINASAAIDLTKLAQPAWTTYTPAFTATTTNPTGWTMTGRYQRVGRIIICTIKAAFGSTNGSGTYRWSLDVACDTTHPVIGNGVFWDNSASEYYHGVCTKVSSTTIDFSPLDINFAVSSYTQVPWSTGTAVATPAASDFFAFNLQYEASS